MRHFFFITLCLLFSCVTLVSAEDIHCGAVLKGGVHVLNQDLTCDRNKNEPERPALVVSNATLDLGGHTLLCKPRGRRRTLTGIFLGSAQLRNGTVRGCRKGVDLGSHNTVDNVTFSQNLYGVFGEAAQHNVLQNLTLEQNSTGVLLQDQSSDNLIVTSKARRNEGGFSVEGGFRNRFLGNTATRNRYRGFGASEGVDVVFSGNIAANNGGIGFSFSDNGSLTATANTSTHNTTGFALQHASQLTFSGNVAQGNTDDGVRIITEARAAQQTLTGNYAFSNGGEGFHLEGPLPTVQLQGNTALGQLFPHFDLADDTQCQAGTWQQNVFDTKSDDCIQ